MANKVIGWIPYSLGLRLAIPGDAESEKRVYALAQERETINLAMLAKHIKEHGSTFSTGTIYGVLQDMVECVQECLLSGYGVNIDGLGKFSNSLSSRGVEVAEDFNPASDITKVGIKFAPDAEAVAYINANAEYEYVGTREEQAEMKKAAKAALTEATCGASSTDDDSSSSSSGSTTGSGDVTE